MRINDVGQVEKGFLAATAAAEARGQNGQKIGRPAVQRLIDQLLLNGLTRFELEAFVGAYKARRDRFDVAATSRIEHFINKVAPRIVTPDPALPARLHGRLPDPELVRGDRHRASYGRVVGVLGAEQIKATDPTQGGQGDCGLISSLSAIAHADPKAIARLFTESGPGKLIVHLHQQKGRRFVPIEIEIDEDLPKLEGKLLYASDAEKGAHWAALVEKAFAKWRGGYDHLYAIYPEIVLEAVLGRPNKTVPLNTLDAGTAYARLDRWLAGGAAMVASSCPKGTSHGKRLKGLVEDHVYAVWRVYKSDDGTPMVELRNPWGSFEPGKDGRDDGVFSLTMQQFLDNFLNIDLTATR